MKRRSVDGSRACELARVWRASWAIDAVSVVSRAWRRAWLVFGRPAGKAAEVGAVAVERRLGQAVLQPQRVAEGVDIGEITGRSVASGIPSWRSGRRLTSSRNRRPDG